MRGRWLALIWLCAALSCGTVASWGVYSRSATPVQGQQDDQQTPGGYPVQIAGLDTNGKARVPKTDSNGNWVVNTSGGTGTGAGQVQGTAADGAAAVGNPVQTGGVDGSGNAQAILTDTSGRPLIAGAAAQGASSTGINPVLVCGVDGTPSLISLRMSQPADAHTNSVNSLTTQGFLQVYNGTNWDRVRAANAASGTTGTGLLGAGVLGFDGANYRIVRISSSLADGQANGTDSVFTISQGFAYNGTNWDRIRTANGAATTAGTGLLGVHNLAYDGTNYQKYQQVYGTQANAWNNAATGAGGTSSSIDTQFASQGEVFGHVSGATTITVQASQDNSNFYDTSTTVAPAGAADFGFNTVFGCRYIRLKSSNNVTATATIAAKT